MFIKKQVVIIGNIKAILPSLLDKLLIENYKINVLIEDSSFYTAKKDTLNRVSYISVYSKQAKEVLNNVEVIINTLFAISPSNIKILKKNINIYHNIKNLINKQAKIIDVLPLINQKSSNCLYKNIKTCIDNSNKLFESYISLFVPVIFSNQDSLLQDIEKLYLLSNKTFCYRETFSYIDKDDLITSIVTLIENTTYNKNDFYIGSYNTTNIDYINDNVIIEPNNLHKTACISWIFLCLLSFIYKNPLNSFSKKYLFFIKACKTTSRNANNLNTLKIKQHSLICMLSKYSNSAKKKIEYEEFN